MKDKAPLRGEEYNSHTSQLLHRNVEETRPGKNDSARSRDNLNDGTSTHQRTFLPISYTVDGKNDAEVLSDSDSSDGNARRMKLRGPGQLLGNLYTKAGAVFKRKKEDLGAKVSTPSTADNNSIDDNLPDNLFEVPEDFESLEEIPALDTSECAKEERLLQNLRFASSEKSGKEIMDICNVLLNHAQSESPKVQFIAFYEIVLQVAHWPPLRRYFQTCCRAQGKTIETTIASWIQSGVSYSRGWLHYHHVVSLSLLPNPISEEMVRIEDAYPSGDISKYARILRFCSNAHEASLGLHFIQAVWTRATNIDRLMQNGQKNLLMRLALAIRARYEIARSTSTELCEEESSFDWIVSTFIQDMWQTLQSREYDAEILGLADRDYLRIWSEVHKIYCASRSEIGKMLTPCARESHSNEWDAECFTQLSHPKFSKLRKTLMQFGGPRTRAPRPPESSIALALPSPSPA